MAILLATDFGAAELTAWTDLLRAALPGERFVVDRRQPDSDPIDIALVANPPPGALAGLPHLRFVQSMWAGVDRLLRDATVPLDVPIARMVDPLMTAAMAETALWAVLGLHRRFFDYAVQQRAAEWRSHPQQRADEVGVAVLGLGRIGGPVAARLAANGYRVSGWSSRPTALAHVGCSDGDAALEPLLAGNDIVVDLLPSTSSTRGLFDERLFSAMRRGACLVNLARGDHVVDADLLAALDSGQLRHAVLDVFAVEPLPPGHRFWDHPRVTVLPHVAAQTDLRSATLIAARNVVAWRQGRPVEHLVDRGRGY